MTSTASNEVTHPVLPTTTRQWMLKRKPEEGEMVTQDHFELVENVPLLNQDLEGKILLKILYISNDPGQRTWMDAGDLNARPYLDAVMGEGQVVFSGGIGVVVASYHNSYIIGDLIFGHFGWTEYSMIEPVPTLPLLKLPQDCSAEDFMALQLSALSAYFGLLRRAEASDELKTVVVTSAAGAVGNIVCQIAKNVLGIKRVVGVCGSNEKATIIQERGYVHVALNYNDPDFPQRFVAATPEYIDLIFDNVGGPMLDLGARRIAPSGKILINGYMSQYNNAEVSSITAAGWSQILNQQATILGFLIMSYYPESAVASADMNSWIADGKLELLKTVHEVSFEEIPDVFVGLFSGGGMGKTITKLKY